MMILVVCGAGASSTFVAQRVRKAAEQQSRQVRVAAGPRSAVTTEVGAGDVVLVGPHLASDFSDVARDAASRGARAVLLPEDIFDDRDGTRSLALADHAAETSERTPR